jgi:hypothetical protein
MATRFSFIAMLFLAGAGKCLAQEPFRPKILHVSTYAQTSVEDSMHVDLTDADLVVLSLTDSLLFDHFEKRIEEVRTRYRGSKLIIAVDRKGVSQKNEFMTDFYGKLLVHDHREAYNKTIAEIREKYETLDFKSAFFDTTANK